MKRTTCCLIALCLTICFVLPVLAADEGVKGEVDWVNGVVIGYGYGTAEASNNIAQAKALSMRAARIDALRNILETVKGVNIDSRTLVSDFMVKKDIIVTRVDGVIKGARMVNQHVEWIEGSPLATVEMRLCFSAHGSECLPGRSLVSALNLAEYKDSKDIPKQTFAGPVEPPKSEPPAKKETGELACSFDSSKPVSGIVLSLQGYYYKRVVLPVVAADKDGELQTIYSVNQVEPRIIRTYGIVRYSDTLGQALKVAELGDNIMIVPVKKVNEENMIIISEEDASKIYETTRHGNDYLSKAGVVVCSE
ncbi:MAG: LPP20 family lipoprotein [Proteobacteria bacterium]|nr:LPP20 family lipoprotein [Pseudomonadota bacterium]